MVVSQREVFDLSGGYSCVTFHEKVHEKHRFQIILNRDFQDTMHRCRAKREDDEGTWISDEMEEAYYELHKEGYAVSVEAFEDGELAGGLYGVSLGRCFFGESMFSERENGSKVALIAFSKFWRIRIFCLLTASSIQTTWRVWGDSMCRGRHLRVFCGRGPGCERIANFVSDGRDAVIISGLRRF